MLVRGKLSKSLMVVPLAVVMAASASVIFGAGRQAAAPTQGLQGQLLLWTGTDSAISIWRPTSNG